MPVVSSTEAQPRLAGCDARSGHAGRWGNPSARRRRRTSRSPLRRALRAVPQGLPAPRSVPADRCRYPALHGRTRQRPRTNCGPAQGRSRLRPSGRSTESRSLPSRTAPQACPSPQYVGAHSHLLSAVSSTEVPRHLVRSCNSPVWGSWGFVQHTGRRPEGGTVRRSLVFATAAGCLAPIPFS